MSRTALILVAVAAIACAVPAHGRGRTNPHLDGNLVRNGCAACHSGHGKAKSPMLGRAQQALCLGCHGSTVAGRDDLAPDGKPAPIGALSAKASVHPMDTNAFSRDDPNAVVCTSCHSPHRSSPEARPDKPNGVRFRAPNDPAQYENDLCLRCHGQASRSDIAAKVNSNNRSYHPLNGPAAERSQSVDAALTGKQVNCTDCHGNNDATGPRGPHASDVAGLLKRGYRQQDGAGESKAAFELCYSCHDRDALLTRSPFPQHAKHIVEKEIACATCHDPHGALASRALIRIDADGGRGGISPSAKTGRLTFISDAPGSGACYLNCHGVEHGPKTYGGAAVQQQVQSAVPKMPRATIGIVPPGAGRWESRGPERGREREPQRP